MINQFIRSSSFLVQRTINKKGVGALRSIYSEKNTNDKDLRTVLQIICDPNFDLLSKKEQIEVQKEFSASYNKISPKHKNIVEAFRYSPLHSYNPELIVSSIINEKLK